MPRSCPNAEGVPQQSGRLSSPRAWAQQARGTANADASFVLEPGIASHRVWMHGSLCAQASYIFTHNTPPQCFPELLQALLTFFTGKRGSGVLPTRVFFKTDTQASLSRRGSHSILLLQTGMVGLIVLWLDVRHVRLRSGVLCAFAGQAPQA